MAPDTNHGLKTKQQSIGHKKPPFECCQVYSSDSKAILMMNATFSCLSEAEVKPTLLNHTLRILRTQESDCLSWI